MERYRDSDHTYLILPAPEGSSAESYPYRMLAANRIRGLLPCRRRNVDGREVLCYDITARQRFLLLCETRPVRAGQVRQLIRDLAALRKELADYLLDVDRILLTEEYVYYDLFEERFFFLYYPDAEERDASAFFSDLADRAGEADRDAAGLLYRISACAAQPDLLFRKLETLDQELREGQAEEGEDGDVWEETADTEDGYDDAEAFSMKQAYAGPAGKDGGPHRKQGLLTVSALLLLLCAGAGAYPQLFPTEARTQFLCLCAAISSFGASLLTAAVWVWKERSAGRSGTVQREPEKPPEQEFAPFAEAFADTPRTEKQHAKSFETVFLGVRGEEVSGLYSEDGSAPPISLRKLPLTVGRMEEHADAVIEDSSVSRVHVRFSREENGDLKMQDLNSTNGTWCNGNLLGPEECVRLKRGDCVRIGTLEYRCR